MEKLQLTDDQAKILIQCLKNVVGTHTKSLSNGTRGKFLLENKADSNTSRKFQVDYMYATDNIHINLMDQLTHLTLIRINLDSSFHNNSDGKVYGHRVEIFSEKEFRAKNDSFTHIKAYPLPYDVLSDTDDFLIAMKELLDYANSHKQNRVQLKIQSSLNI